VRPGRSRGVAGRAAAEAAVSLGVRLRAGPRRGLLREAWKDAGTVLVAGVVLDVIYQVIALHTVYPGEAVLAGLLLVVVPYLLVRGR
jgi:hypothetical protein